MSHSNEGQPVLASGPRLLHFFYFFVTWPPSVTLILSQMERMEMPHGVVEQIAFGNFQPRASTGSYWVGSDITSHFWSFKTFSLCKGAVMLFSQSEFHTLKWGNRACGTRPGMRQAFRMGWVSSSSMGSKGTANYRKPNSELKAQLGVFWSRLSGTPSVSRW